MAGSPPQIVISQVKNEGELMQALAIREQPQADEAADAALAASAVKAVEDAMAELEHMRIHEGAHLRADLDGRRRLLADLIERVAAAAAEGQRGLQERLSARVAELTADLPK